jgi:PAS domain S-box-containing protein
VSAPIEPQTSLEERVQRTIVADIVTTTLPLITGFLVLLTIAGLSTGAPRRAMAASIFFFFALGAWFSSRTGRTTLAARLYMAGAVVSVSTALVFNGGLLAPATLTLVASVVLIGWLVGNRGATWAAVVSTAVVVLVAVLDERALLPTPGPAAIPQRAMATIFAVWLAWAGTSMPQRRLRHALRDSLQREQELIAAEERRRRSELAFEAIFEQAGQLMLLVEQNGTLLRANRAALEALDGAQLVMGRSLLETLQWSPEQQARLREALQAAGPGAPALQLQVTDAKGHSFDLTLSPVRDVDAESRRVIVQGRDISGLLEAKDREARSRRLALVGQLAGGVAHDFNNVLAVTLTSVDALREELAASGPLPAPVAECLDDISSVTHRAADLTKRLLSFGRKAPLVRKARSMHELVRATLTLLTRTLPANISLKAELRAEEDFVEVDAASFESVLLNLAINARDAMPAGGVLTLTSELTHLDEAACRATDFEVRPGRYVRLTVADTGHGIAPEVRGRIFEPFFTTKAEGKGSGIGLASVMGAMQEHRGAVSLESEVGRGTRFHLLFPLADAVPAVAAEPRADRSLAGLTALVVDDEPQLRALIARQLERFGVAVVVAADAEAGKAAFDEAPSRFDFAVLDVVLPGRSGSELAKDLIAATPLKVLLISGYPRDADVSSMPADRVSLLGKPFSGEALKAALTHLLAR